MPAARRASLTAIRERLQAAESIVLTTHINPDGDGLGSMVALALRLQSQGKEVSIVTPSRPPTSLAFVVTDVPAYVADDPAAADPLNRCDTIGILDTAEPKRLGALPSHIARVGGVLIDHHPAVDEPIVEPWVRDPTACATGELIFDLLSLDKQPLTRQEADALYVAMVTDTGSFQFSNTNARTHQIAAELVAAGVDPGQMYRALYGVYTSGKLALIRLGLESLEVDPQAPIAWVAVGHDALSLTGARGEDMEGLVEYPRRLKEIEVGLLFRGLSSNRTKVSLRSNGEVDVSEVAQKLGGGGHTKASGVVIERDLESSIRAVLDELRPKVQAVLEEAATAQT